MFWVSEGYYRTVSWLQLWEFLERRTGVIVANHPYNRRNASTLLLLIDAALFPAAYGRRQAAPLN